MLLLRFLFPQNPQCVFFIGRYVCRTKPNSILSHQSPLKRGADETSIFAPIQGLVILQRTHGTSLVNAGRIRASLLAALKA